MVHPCCGHSLQSRVSYLALFDIVWTFVRTIYHLNELLTTFDAWVIAGRIPAYGPITSSIDGYFVILYVAYFAMAILLIMGAHNVIPHAHVTATHSSSTTNLASPQSEHAKPQPRARAISIATDVRKCSLWVYVATILVTIQLATFVTCTIVGRFLPFATIASEVPPSETSSWYWERDTEFLVLKVPLQALSSLGCFYTLYEIWVVQLFMEEIYEERDL